MPDDKDRKPYRIIDVTKPKNEPTRSSIDASRISAHTMREQQALEKLKKQVGTLNQHDNRMSKIKTVVAIILVIILILLLVVFVIVLGRTGKSEEENYDIRVSMEIENKDLLTVIAESGREELRPINPGDRLQISAYARNSNNYRGDDLTGTNTPPNIYVRFKIRLILNYVERYDVLIPKINSNWYVFDSEADGGEGNYNDHYYYFCGSVPYLRKIELFSQLKVDGNSITCDDADIGRYGQIQVLVDSIEANTDNLANGVWDTAPKTWRLKTIRGDYNSNKV